MPRNDRSSVTLGALGVAMIRDTNGFGCETDLDRSFLDNEEIELLQSRNGNLRVVCPKLMHLQGSSADQRVNFDD